MTTTRAILGTVTAFIALIVLTAYGSMFAALMGRMEIAEGLHHASWMFVLTGAMCAAAGLVIVMALELNNEVRTARVLGTVTAPATGTGENPVGSGAVRRDTRGVAELADARWSSGRRDEGSTPSVLHSIQGEQ